MGDSSDASTRPMPRYKCHKEVSALQIGAVVLDDGHQPGATITPADERFAPFHVDHAYVERHKPQVGGFFVVYNDGYQSFSPAKAFEEGYTLAQ